MIAAAKLDVEKQLKRETGLLKTKIDVLKETELIEQDVFGPSEEEHKTMKSWILAEVLGIKNRAT